MADVTEEPSLADQPTLTFADAGVPLVLPVAPRRASPWPTVLVVGSDALLILIGFALAYWMRYNVSWPAPFNRIVQEVLTVNYVPFANFLPYALLLTFTLLALFAMKSLYRIPRNAGLLDYAGTLISGSTTGIALVVLLTIIQRPLYSRLLYAFAWGAIIVLLCASRAVVVSVRRWRWARGRGRERVLVVGGTGLGRQVMDSIVAQTFLGYSLLATLRIATRRPPSDAMDISAISAWCRTWKQSRARSQSIR